jgi:poly(beta-D-mannuronate) lyase
LKENLFENADGEGVEIISIKSNRNWIQDNTFLSSTGSLNVRRGSDNIISNNTILCNAKSGAQGIRISGQRNLIEKNYISNCEYGIAVSSGEFWDHPLTNLYDVNDRNGSKPNKSRYPQNKFDVIRENIFVSNSGPDLDIGVRV